MKRIIFLDIILVLFAVLFVYAAASKLLSYDEFKVQISKSPLIMNQGWWIAWWVPATEIVIGIMLFIPRLQLIGLYGSFFVMFVFTMYIGFMLTFVPDLPCSCGGILSKMGWTEHFIFNVCFTLLAIGGIILLNQERKFRPLRSAV